MDTTTELQAALLSAVDNVFSRYTKDAVIEAMTARVELLQVTDILKNPPYSVKDLINGSEKKMGCSRRQEV